MEFVKCLKYILIGIPDKPSGWKHLPKFIGVMKRACAITCEY